MKNDNLTRSVPSNFFSKSSGPFNRVHTGAVPMATPFSFAPISAPHIQAGLLNITACVWGTCSISMYVH